MLRRPSRLDLLSTLLLGLGAVATSWSTYQSTRWSGVQADEYGHANTLRVHASEHLTTAGQLRAIDIVVFGAWLHAYAEGRHELVDFYQRRFRQEFAPAFDVWIRGTPRENPAAPSSPFALPEYRLADQHEAARLDREADAAVRLAQAANEQSDTYVLTTVLLAMVLFFAGTAPQVPWRPGQITLLVFASGLCVVALVVLVRSPIR